MTDFAQRRTVMVDTQVRPSDVTEFPIIEAMLTVPREQFVPADYRDAAYAGAHVPLAKDRVVLEPRTFAKMLEVVDLKPNDLVLDIGSGLGYSSAVIARMTEAVIALEDEATRVGEAERALSEFGADNVAVVEGPLAEGAEKHGPYDVIFIQGAVEQVPEALTNQLKDGGRIVCIFLEDALGVVRVGYRLDDRINWCFAFNATAPLLDGFEKSQEFAL